MIKELHITNELSQLAVLSDFVTLTSKEIGLDERMCMRLNLALEEAVTNVILYAYSDEKNKDITIRMETNDNRLKITLIDSGIAFDPTAKATPDTTLPLNERPIGGLGIHLIKQLMTEVTYSREENKNILTMIKELC